VSEKLTSKLLLTSDLFKSSRQIQNEPVKTVHIENPTTEKADIAHSAQSKHSPPKQLSQTNVLLAFPQSVMTQIKGARS
jgi:hypothetical protein